MSLWEGFTLQVFLMKRHNTQTHLYQDQGKKHSHDSSKTCAKDILKNDMLQVGEVLKIFPLYVVTLLKERSISYLTRLLFPVVVPTIVTFAIRMPSIVKVNRFTLGKQTMPQLKSIAFLADTFIFLTTISQVILISHQNYLRVCVAWVEFFRVPLQLQQCSMVI